MDKFLKFWYEKIRPKFIYLIIVLIILFIFIDNKSCYINYIFLSICSLFLFLYAYAFRKNTSKLNKYNLSIMILSIIICAVILSSVHNNFLIFIFYFMIIDDIFDNYKYHKVTLIIFHFFICILSIMIKLSIFENSSLVNSLEALLYLAITYALILLPIIVIHKNKEEKDELKILNYKLIEYSFKERDYLISEERSRISQELHDSLGHLLMALSMNVQYAKALDDKDKIREELLEIGSLVEESVKTLRSTVCSLKKLDEDFNLHEELKRLILKFNNLDMVKINLHYTDEIEKISGMIKNILLITVKEAITNSIKHGNASIINIDMELQNNKITLKINDDGIGCNIIKESNGLLGISNRFEKINGKVYFNSKENNGFYIEALIPIKSQEGEFTND